MERELFLKEFEAALEAALSPDKIGTVEPLTSAMRYAASSGGKRLRPFGVLLGAEFANEKPLTKEQFELVLSIGVSLEFVHTYSLIHDDLPAMDNDDYRRGRLTVHKQFDEATAILAGDALLNLAYERLFDLAKRSESVRVLDAANEIAKNAGVFGMVRGQQLDLNGKINSIDDLLEINRYKTGCLFKAAFISGALAIGCEAKAVEALTSYAENLGAAFQIADDLLDTDKIENSVVKFIGVENSQILKKKLTNNAIFAISNWGKRAEALSLFAIELEKRKR